MRALPCLKVWSVTPSGTKPIAPSADERLAVYGSVLAFRSALPKALFIIWLILLCLGWRPTKNEQLKPCVLNI